MDQITDYKQASNIVKTLELHKEITVKVNVLGNFRKYLKDCSKEKQFITRSVDGGVKVTRLS